MLRIHGRKWFSSSLCACITAALVLFSLEGCDPTYPKKNLPAVVKTVCKTEYDMDVDVTVIGSTMGIYYKMEGLLEPSLQISEKSWDTITDLVTIASRVVLSTDADIKFYCVITQDIRLPELQVVIIKYVDDVKRSMFRYISRSESFRRTLFSINLTPQAKKEKSIERIFDKMKVEDEIRQNILDDFFRSLPTRLSDIGYWRGSFYLKNISMQEFLAAQIANRIKIEFRSEEDLKTKFRFISSEGLFTVNEGIKVITVRFKIDDQTVSLPVNVLRQEKTKEIIGIVDTVVSGYKYEDFDLLLLEDQLENVVLTVKAKDLFNFTEKKLPIIEIVDVSEGYF